VATEPKEENGKFPAYDPTAFESGTDEDSDSDDDSIGLGSSKTPVKKVHPKRPKSRLPKVDNCVERKVRDYRDPC
jgi:hypothetical protein